MTTRLGDDDRPRTQDSSGRRRDRRTNDRTNARSDDRTDVGSEDQPTDESTALLALAGAAFCAVTVWFIFVATTVMLIILACAFALAGVFCLWAFWRDLRHAPAELRKLGRRFFSK